MKSHIFLQPVNEVLIHSLFILLLPILPVVLFLILTSSHQLCICCYI